MHDVPPGLIVVFVMVAIGGLLSVHGDQLEAWWRARRRTPARPPTAEPPTAARPERHTGRGTSR